MATQPTHGTALKNIDSLKPGNFSGIDGRVAPFTDHIKDYRNRSTGIYTVGVLKGRSGIDQESVQPIDFSDYVKEFGERPDKDVIISRYKTRYREYANIPDNRIIVMRGRPRINFNAQGKLAQPVDLKTQQTMVKEFVAQIGRLKNSRAVTVANIVDLVGRSEYSSADPKLSPSQRAPRIADKPRQTPFLSAVLQHYIKKPGGGHSIYPLQVLPDMRLLKNYGIRVPGSIVTDFGEVLGPVAYLTGNTTGSGNKMITEILNANYQQLERGATIHFNSGENEALYDSFIEYDGKVIGISSKGHTGGTAAAKPNVSGLTKAINEIKSNPDALQRLKKLFRDPDNKRMFDIVSRLADSERGQKMNKSLRLLQLLHPQEYPTKDLYSDLRLMQTKDTRNLSPYIRNKMALYSKGKNAWERFARAANEEIVNTLNSNPKFSEVCCWIFNHSNIIQIDITSSKPNDRGGAFVIENITATWPSTRVDRIQLNKPQGVSLQFELIVNGYASKYPERADQLPGRMDYSDQVVQRSTDPEREYSGVTSAADWAARAVNAPRSTVTLPNIGSTSPQSQLSSTVAVQQNSGQPLKWPRGRPSTQEARTRRIISLARAQGKALDVERARQEITTLLNTETSDEEIARRLSESTSGILLGVNTARILASIS